MKHDKSNDENNAQPAAASARRKIWLYRAIFVLLGLAPFILLEAGLRVFHVGETELAQDPFAGFNSRNPLFEKSGDAFQTSRLRSQFFPEQEFKADKPAEEFRVFVLGGSTVYGKPFLAGTAFPKWLELELNARQSKRAVKVINCGGISYASHRLLHVAREIVAHSPDLVILATGHNEFLEDRTYYSLKSRSSAQEWAEHTALSLRTVSLARRWLGKDEAATLAPPPDEARAQQMVEDVQTRLDDHTGFASFKRDAAWQDRVASEFDLMIREIVNLCRSESTPLALVRLGSNHRDCPPFKSEHRTEFPPDAERTWQAAFDRGERLENDSPRDALKVYQEAETIDGEHALLLYRIARCHDRLGNHEQAARYYDLAKENDICPLRILNRLADTLSTIAKETQTPLIDAKTVLANASSESIPGFDFYLDHVHPSLGGHQQIARALLDSEQLRDVLPVLESSWDQKSIFEAHFKSLPRNYFSNGRRRLEWLDNWARRERLLDEIAPRDAAGFVRQGMRRYEFGNEDGAWESFSSALKHDAVIAKRLLTAYSAELRRQGRPNLSDRLDGRLNSRN